MNIIAPEDTYFATIFRNATFGIAVMDGVNRVLEVNPALQKLLGCSENDLLGRTPLALLNPAQSETCNRDINRLLLGDATSIHCRHRYPLESGKDAVYALTICRARGANSPSIIAIYEEKKCNDEDARRAQNPYQSLFENAIEGIFQSTPRGQYLAINSAFATKLGYESADDLKSSVTNISEQIYVDSTRRKEFEQIICERGEVREFESEVRKKDGTKIWVTETARAVRDKNNEISYFKGHLEDITKRKRAEEELKKSVFHDGLTGLPNRDFFMDRLAQMIARSKRRGDSPYAVMFLDGDRFKRINDSLGHFAGDQLLMQLATRLKDSLRDEDTLARLGGDEFGILLEDIEDPEYAMVVAKRIEESLETPFAIENQEIVFGVSVGIALGDVSYEDPTAPLRDADIAMYESKSKGRQRFTLFDPSMGTRAANLMQMENDLRTALDKNQFVVFYQPIMDLDATGITGFEALIRWQHPEDGLIGPDDFISIAEDTGMIMDIGDWILGEACHQIVEWQKIHGNKDLTISVNLSPEQLRQPDIVERISDRIRESNVKPDCVKLEITESTIMRNPVETRKKLEALRNLGLRFSIDDFGTGYSSLAQLGQFPIDILKIDRSFISAMGNSGGNSGGESGSDPDSGTDIVRTILELGRALGMEVIAEGVETETDQATLQSMNCPYAQGFLFSRPVSRSDAAQLLSTAME